MDQSRRQLELLNDYDAIPDFEGYALPFQAFPLLLNPSSIFVESASQASANMNRRAACFFQ